jgi:uncharacterized protein YjbI with pentapeptide repeats
VTRDETLASLAVNAWINRGRVVWPWADLRGCDLSGADLSGAYLHGANLREADLSGAKIELGNRTFTLNEETSR